MIGQKTFFECHFKVCKIFIQMSIYRLRNFHFKVYKIFNQMSIYRLRNFLFNVNLFFKKFSFQCQSIDQNFFLSNINKKFFFQISIYRLRFFCHLYRLIFSLSMIIHAMKNFNFQCQFMG